MAKTKISEFDVNPDNNTDINNINIAEGCAPSGINNAIRQLMSDLKAFQTGADGDPFNGAVNGTVGATTPNTGAFTTLSASSTVSGSGFSTYLASPPAIGSSTANTGAFTTLSASSTLTVTGAGSIQGLTVGRGAGAVSTNTAVGASALVGNSTGAYNTAVGYQAAYTATGSGISAFGTQALKLNTTGTDNAAFGGLPANAGNNAALYANTTGSNNSAFGISALAANTTGGSNSAFGNYALQANTTASNNTAVGYQAGYSNTTGTNNAYLGQGAGYTNTTSNSNTFLGRIAGYYTTGNSNTFVGYYAGGEITTGSKNVVIGGFAGNQGGLDIRTASNYIVLSDGDGNPRGYFDNNGTYIIPKGNGGNLTGASNAAIYLPTDESSIQGIGTYTQIRMGNNLVLRGTGAVTCQTNNSGGVNLSSGATSWAAVSDERLKDIIEPISNGVEKVSNLRAVIGKYKTDEQGTRRSFLIAQDVESVLPEAIDTDDKGMMSVRYTEVIPLLVSAIQELKAEVDSLKAQINGA